MALRARLAAPAPSPRQDWPYHDLKSASVPASILFSGERRLEAETYLSTGFGIRAAIESKATGWTRLGELAKIWMPGRLKGIQVSSEYGTPFLAATQVFDVRPIPRKWLSLARTSDAENRFVQPGTILVTCSGSVGRPTLATECHSGILISHDLLRVQPLEEKQYGWIYAALLSSQVRAMATGAQYGHIIKHLETSHLADLPVPLVEDETADELARRVRRILELRNQGFALSLEAEQLFEEAFGAPDVSDWGEHGFTVLASERLTAGTRRFEASAHNPGAQAIRKRLAERGRGFTTIAAAGYDVWLPSRFKRVPATDGVFLVDSADLTEANPDLSKRIADGDCGDAYRGRVSAGWVLMARSGQTYGIIGTTVLAGADLEGHIVSDHVMRLRPRDDASILPGYLTVAMSHPRLGRPLVKALAYGSSIPEIDPAEVSRFEIVRLSREQESAIASIAQRAAKARADADILEKELALEASRVIDRFIVKP